MKLDIKKISELKREIRIEVDSDDLKVIRDKVLDRINQKVNISGFRRGKAPSELIEKRFPELVKEELLKETIPVYYNKALEQEKLEAVGLPNIKDSQYQKGTVKFTAELEIKPQIQFDDKVYKHIKLKVSPVNIEDKEIEKFIDQLKEKLSEFLKKKKEDIDNKFAASWSGYESEEEFRKAINSQLHFNRVIQRRRNLEKEITDTLLSKIKFEIPQSLVEEQKKHILTQHILDLHSRGVPEEEVKKHYDEVSGKSESIAKEQIKLYYILEEIAKKEYLTYNKDNIYEVVVGFILSNAFK